MKSGTATGISMNASATGWARGIGIDNPHAGSLVAHFASSGWRTLNGRRLFMLQSKAVLQWKIGLIR